MTMTFKKSVAALASVAALTAAGNANAFLQNWYFDSDGANSGAAVKVSEYLDLNGQAYINNSFSTTTNFTFQEAGTFITLLADSQASKLLPTAINSTFTGTGSGVVGSGITFDAGGILKVYSGAAIPANQIGEFVLQQGEGVLQGSSLVPNGEISLVFKATSLDTGYFFTDAGLTNDLATAVTAGSTVLFGFASTNASSLADWGGNGGNSDVTLTTLYNGVFNPDITNIANNGTTELVISNNGQFRLAIPEPTSMALVGLGLTGLAALRRRKA